MGHQNIQFTRQLNNPEADQGPARQRRDACTFYPSGPSFPLPNLQSVVPAPGSQCNFNVHPIAESQENPVFYSMPMPPGPPYYGVVQPQYPGASLGVSHVTVGAPSSHYNPYLAPPPVRRDFPVQVNHGALDQFSLPATSGLVAVPTDSYCRNIPSTDGVIGLFKSKNSEGIPNYHHQSASAGPSSSVNHITSAPPFQLPISTWLPRNSGANNGHPARPYAHNLTYGYANANGMCIEAGAQGYPLRAINRGPVGFIPPPYAQGHPNQLSPAQLFQAVTFNGQLQVATSSRGTPTNSLSNTGINPSPGFGTYLPTRCGPHQREIAQNTAHRNLPHLRVLPEDEVAILEIPGYREVGTTFDQHRDLRLDIDHMSYEELLALEEQIGSVGTGLSQESIQNKLKVRTFKLLPSPARTDLEATNNQQRTDFCVVCQTDYEPEQKIGTLDCGHEYHNDCIKKWLLMKNTCPVCKSPALKKNP